MYRKFFFLLVFFVITSFLFSEEKDLSMSWITTSKKDKKEKFFSKEEKKEILLKGIFLTDNFSDINPFGFEHIKGIKTQEINIPGNKYLLYYELNNFLKKPINKQLIEDIRLTIIQFYRSYNHPVVMVIPPKQELSYGVLQLIVLEGKVADISIIGNKWFSSKFFKKQIKIKSGDTIEQNKIQKDIDWIDRNPFRRCYAIYSPGEKLGTTDIEFLIDDRLPFRLYGGINNTGNDVTGNNRLFAGLNSGNFLWLDQLLSYQFTSSDDFSRFHSHTLNYIIPFSWRHILSIFGGYSHSSANYALTDVEQLFKNSGFSLQASMRYTIPFSPKGGLRQEFIWGGDFKRTNNNLNLGGQPVVAKLVNITQLMCEYNLNYHGEKTIANLGSSFFWSPGKWISDQSGDAFGGLRPLAKNYYFYFRPTFDLSLNFYKNAKIYLLLRGQYATENLIYCEQYGVGGFDTVRGYKEREINFDNAFILNSEIHSPSFSIARIFYHKKIQDACQFLFFFDLGWGEQHRTPLGEIKSSTLLSIGPAVRYNIVPYLLFRTDWGFQLRSLGSDGLPGPHQRLHFSLVLGF